MGEMKVEESYRINEKDVRKEEEKEEKRQKRKSEINDP